MVVIDDCHRGTFWRRLSTKLSNRFLRWAERRTDHSLIPRKVAPDLSLMWARDGVNDEYVFNVVRHGVPGSIMPPHGLSETELWMLVSFMASLSEGSRDAEFEGDAGNGRRLFADNCAECHRVGAEAGGVLGPALTGVTRRRSPEALMRSIRAPSERIERGFRSVTVETDAESVTGALQERGRVFAATGDRSPESARLSARRRAAIESAGRIADAGHFRGRTRRG